MHRAMTGADCKTQLNRSRDKLLRQRDRAVDLFALGELRGDGCREGAAGAVGVFGADARRVERGKFFTVVKEINTPRVPSLKGIMRSKQAKITCWTHKDIEADFAQLGLNGSPTQVAKVFTPAPRGKGQMFSGTTDDIVAGLVNILKEQQ